jgi:predicted metal-binding integral membrane protein DUF2182
VITISATKVSPTGTGTTTPRSVRSILDVVMLVGLFIVVLADGVAQGLEGAIIPTVLVFQALYLLCGIVVATVWCWALMLVMFGLGVGNLVSMALLTEVKVVEKTFPGGWRLSRVIGVALLGLVHPTWLSMTSI